ncbi:MAG: hypothetical protein D6790_19220 [Caldilineae bacterium]|nr:MAG: hypothetical protein D6790_19220 [Caldilineae bacterium]
MNIKIINEEGQAPASKQDILADAIKGGLPPHAVQQQPVGQQQQGEQQVPPPEPAQEQPQQQVPPPAEQQGAEPQQQAQQQEDAVSFDISFDEEQPAQPQEQQQPQAVAVPPIVEAIANDDKLRTIVGAYLASGDVEAVRLMRLADELDSMDDMSVLRTSVKLDEPDADDELVDVMVSSMLRNYGVDDNTMDEDTKARMIKVIANKNRKKIQERVSELRAKADEKVAQLLQGADAQQAVPAEVLQKVEQVKTVLSAHPVVEKVRTHKALPVTVNGEEVMIPVGDADELLRVAVEDVSPLLQLMIDEKTQMPDMRKVALAMAMLRDPMQFIKHFVGVGRTLTIKELGSGVGSKQPNVREPQPQVDTVEEGSKIDRIAEAILKARRRV